MAPQKQTGLPVNGKLARGFGWQKGSDGWPRFSDGVELQVDKGAPVRAVLPGQVSRVFSDPTLGTVVVVDHSDQLATLYGRLDAVGVQSGQQVDQGQVLGTVAGKLPALRDAGRRPVGRPGAAFAVADLRYIDEKAQRILRLFIMRPHPENLDHAFFLQDFIDDPVMDVDPS